MSTFAPTTKADLATAVQAWVTNGTAATTTYGHISTWNVSAITDMSSLCMNKTNFNGDIANWNVSNVTDMSNMFNGVNAFNRGIGIWDVSKVRNMQGMFGNTQYSSMALNAWNVSNVTNMTSMFSGSIRYDQNFRGWSVQPSTILTSMFSGATAMITNQGVSTTPSYTYFNKASAPTYQAITTRAQLDAAITAWIANSVTAAVTYGDINTWDIFTITDMSNLFSGKSTFNSNISGWNVSRVTNMSGMFNGAVAFNQPINSWTVNRVTNMSSMFMNASAFNLNISGWIVGRATLFSDMFSGATAMIANQGAAITPLYTYFTQAPNTLPTGSVTISGTPTQKLVLTVLNTLADADGLGPFTYQWKRAGSNISGAIGSTYTLVQGDVGFAITVTVSYIDLQGTVESITSSATAAVANANDIATGSVTISGSPIQNQVLTASNTLVDIDGLGPITYQWKRGGVTISGATGSTYTLVQGDVGFAITVTASYTDLLGSAESATSAATAIIAPAPIVTISGSATQREFLTAETNGITDVGSLGAFSYQWKRSSTLGVAGSNILVDAIGSTYQLIQDDVNKYITVTVSYTDVLEQIKTITSDATSAVINMNDIATGWPVINGTATQGKVLTVDTTGIGDVDGLGTFEYKWLRKSTAAGQSYSSIPGATSDTYTLTPDDVSKYIMVTVKFTDGGGSIEVRASDATAAVAPFVPLPTATRGQLDAAVTAWCSDSIAATDVYGPISSWDVSAITDMSTLFTAKVSFNSDISAWNVSNVTNMQSMFDSAFAFNQPLNAWNVSNVTNMDSMFRDNYIFNQPLNTWSVSRVTNMRGMFRGAYVFNQDISTWNVSIVTDMVGMFLNARDFNWNIRGWYVGQATLRTDMFLGATAMLATPDTIATPPYTYFTQAPVANTPPTGSVTITGTATQNQILTASHTLADANGPVTLTVSYQWKRSLSSSVAGSNISLNATSSTYTLVPDDVGKYITVTVSYTDGLTNAESVTSGSTEVVAPFVPLPTAPTESVNKSCDFVLPTLNASFELLQALSIVGNYGAPAPFALPTITLPMSASLFNDGLFHLELVDSNIHTLLDPATEAVYFSEKITYYADDAKFPELKSNGNKYLRELPVMNGSASTSTHLRQRNADVDGLAASMVHELAYQLTGISLMDDQLANGVSLRTVIDNYITTALPAALKSKLAACNGKTQNISGASDMTDQRNVPRELFMQIVESVVGDRNGTHLAKSSRLNTLFHSSNFAGGKYGIKFIAGDTLRFTVTISPSANHIDYIVDGMPHAVQETRAVEVIITMM